MREQPESLAWRRSRCAGNAKDAGGFAFAHHGRARVSRFRTERTGTRRYHERGAVSDCAADRCSLPGGMISRMKQKGHRLKAEEEKHWRKPHHVSLAAR